MSLGRIIACKAFLGFRCYVMAGFALAFSSAETRGVGDDAAAMREQIISIWQTMDSVEFGSVETMEDETTRSTSTTKIDFSWMHDGRSAISWTREEVGEKSYLDERNNGSKLTLITFFPTPPKTIMDILIRPSHSGSSGHYIGKYFSSLWILLPGGESISDLLKEGANLTNDGTQRNPRWRLKHQINKIDIDCVLDEKHGYLPAEMTAINGSNRRSIKVDRFDLADGFWYPSGGTATYSWAAYKKEPARAFQVDFKVDRIVFSRAVDPAKFIVNEYPPGISVVNEIENTRFYVGGKLAHTKLMLAHPQPKQNVPTNLPLKVTADAGSWARRWVSAALIGIATVTGSLGVYYRLKSS